MITLSYRRSSEWNDKADIIDLASADELTLRYHVVLGDVIFRIDSCDYSTTWGWVPILDFVASIRTIAMELSKQSTAEALFEFTESDSSIAFKRSETELRIRSSYAPCESTILFDKFVNVVHDFSDAVHQDMVRRYPMLQLNQSYARLWGQDGGQTEHSGPENGEASNY